MCMNRLLGDKDNLDNMKIDNRRINQYNNTNFLW